jgi:rubrerythrin
MKKKTLEQVVQKFLYRCPYCDHFITYDDLHLKPGENEIKCPSCKRTYIKIVPDSSVKRGKK